MSSAPLPEGLGNLVTVRVSPLDMAFSEVEPPGETERPLKPCTGFI